MTLQDEEIEDTEQPVEPSALLAPVRDEVIALNEDTDPQTLLLAMGKVKNLIAEAKEFLKLVQDVTLERIQIHGPIPVRPGVYYIAADDKTTKCNNVAATAEALMEASGGDVTLFCGTISANGIKPGAAKKLLGEKFDEHFTVTTKKKLVEGKEAAVKKLLRIDENLLR